jgi:uncharacterized protein (DUF433 family)
MNWTDCDAIEVVPGKMAGQPVIRGTRVRPEDLLINRDEGLPWLAENYSIPQETIREVFACYDRRQDAHLAKSGIVASFPRKRESRRSPQSHGAAGPKPSRG